MNTFRDEESIHKLATLIRYFILRGGHQIQLNAVDVEQLREAQKDPDRYRQLIVRIWGWSAYFVELDKPYQEHVIARQEYTL
jgi:formate C-acetyltransferase